MRRWTPLLLLLVTTTAQACTGSGAKTPDPTVPTSATRPTTRTTAVADIATIPAVIDAPYLNRVLAALDGVETAAVRVILATKDVPPEAARIFNAIYSDEWFTREVNAWIDALGQDPKLSSIKDPPGDRRTTVNRLIATSPRCVWMAVNRDYTLSDVHPRTRTEYVALQPLDHSNDPDHHNPTAWMITADGFQKDGSEPANPCPVS